MLRTRQAIHNTAICQLTVSPTTDTSRSDVGMLARQAGVRMKLPSREVSTAAWPPLHPHGSNAWRRKVAQVRRYRSIWHHSMEHMEQHLAASDAGMCTALDVVTHVISSGAATGVHLVAWIVSCVLTQRSR